MNVEKLYRIRYATKGGIYIVEEKGIVDHPMGFWEKIMNEEEAKLKIKEIEHDIKCQEEEAQKLRRKKKALLLAIKTWKEQFEQPL